MRQTALFIIFLFFVKLHVNGQQAEQNKFSLNVSTGYVSYTSNDPLLNYYNYSGQSLLPLSLDGHYRNNKNLFFVNLYNSNSKLYPQRVQDAFYTFNYIKQWNADLFVECYRKIALVHKYIQIYAGVSNNASINLQEEFYNNLLFEYGEGYRKSYNLSLLDISTNVLIYINYSKNFLKIKSGYTIINYSARPDDNFVKQFGVNEAAIWKISTPKNHTGFQFSLFYQFNFWEKTGINAEFNMLYHSYSSPAACKYLRVLYLIGVNKSF